MELFNDITFMQYVNKTWTLCNIFPISSVRYRHGVDVCTVDLVYNLYLQHCYVTFTLDQTRFSNREYMLMRLATSHKIVIFKILERKCYCC